MSAQNRPFLGTHVLGSTIEGENKDTGVLARALECRKRALMCSHETGGVPWMSCPIVKPGQNRDRVPMWVPVLLTLRTKDRFDQVVDPRFQCR